MQTIQTPPETPSETTPTPSETTPLGAIPPQTYTPPPPPVQQPPAQAYQPQPTTFQTPSAQAYQPQPTPTQPIPPQPQYTPPARYEERIQRREERHTHQTAAGIPVWGVLLILVGAIALFSNLGIGLGWIFGLALGAWFVYLGVRHMQEGLPVNWWLVGLGLLIGLGSISTPFTNIDNGDLIFPIVLVVVGLGILAEQYLFRQNR